MSRLSIRTRLTAWYAGALAVGLGGLAATSYWAVHRSLHAAVDAGLRGRLEGTRQFIAQQLPGHSVRQITDEFQDHLVLALGPGFSLIQVCDSTGTVLYQADLFREAGVPPPLPDALPAMPQYEEARVAGRQLRMVTTRLDVEGRRFGVRLATLTDDIELALDSLRGPVFLLAPIVLAFAWIGGYWISARALRPVDTMTGAVQQITSRSLAQRLAVPSTGDELQRLAETLNSMLDRLDAAFRQIGRFTADASHELRTPVTLIRTSAELALRKTRTLDEYRQTLTDIALDAERMSMLVEDLLTLARADQDMGALPLAPIDLSALLRTTAPEAEQRAHSCGLEFSLCLPAMPLIVFGDTSVLQRLMTILTDNACKYTPPPGRIEWCVYSSDDTATIDVRDTGIGVAPDERARIFERFYRTDAARARDSGGTGLGLSIAHSIVTQHRGSIVAEGTGARGSVFRVTLPVAARRIHPLGVSPA